MTDRILWNERGGDIDEIVLENVTVHVEQMSENCWWIGIYKDDDTMWSGNFHTARAAMHFTEQDNEGIVWAQDSAHREPVKETVEE